MGNIERARKSLEDALKCDYDRWEVWDNFMVVNIDLGYFSEVSVEYINIFDNLNFYFFCLSLHTIELIFNIIALGILIITESRSNIFISILNIFKLFHSVLGYSMLSSHFGFERCPFGCPSSPDINRCHNQ